jgi:hypothetical protein
MLCPNGVGLSVTLVTGNPELAIYLWQVSIISEFI